MIKQSEKERFWRKVITSEDGCWGWRGAKHPSGYGSFYRSPPIRTVVYASRFSYELHFGSIPEGLLVCHHCDNPACTNPEHLFLGTYRDNAVDRDSKNRSGVATRFTLPQKQRIIELREGGASVNEIADLVGVGTTSVTNFLKLSGVFIPYQRWAFLSDVADDIIAYREQGYSYKQIGDHYGVSYRPIRRLLEARGVTDRLQPIRGKQLPPISSREKPATIPPHH